MQGKAAHNHDSLSQSRIQSGKHVNTLSHQSSFGKFEIQGQHTDFNTKKDFQQFLKNKSPYRQKNPIHLQKSQLSALKSQSLRHATDAAE